MIRIGAMALLCAVAVSAPPLAAQQRDTAALTVGLTLDEAPRVGRPAPALVLPYATRDGAGPVDQPFDLRRELGRVVVIAFYPGDFTPGCTAEWRAFRNQSDTVFGAGVVVAGVSGDSLGSHVLFARDLDLPFKLLSDASRGVSRQWGVDGTSVRRVVVVVGRDGRVRYVDRAFGALDPQSYSNLATAVKAAKES